jgi:predicted molibdopterin-dependent oxidoreductase YjgC
MARVILDEGLARPEAMSEPSFVAWQANLADFALDRVAARTGIEAERIREAAMLYATGGAGVSAGGPFPPSLIYQTVAHSGLEGAAGDDYGDPAEITAACINLAIVTGNFGLPGGGVASPRGPANAQGSVDMGAHPALLPGGLAATDTEALLRFEAAWMPRWGDRATTSNGFVPVRNLTSGAGLSIGDLPAAIEAGRIKAMIIGNTIEGRFTAVNAPLLAALPRLEFLAVTDFYAGTPLARLANIVLPMSMSMEKDGTFTAFDRTVQRLRAAVPPMGEAKSGIDIFSLLARRMGYGLAYRSPAQVMDEIAKLVPGYGGIVYARLERHGVPTPTRSYGDEGTPILPVAGGDALAPRFIAPGS